MRRQGARDCMSAQWANVRTKKMYVHCTYKPVHTDLVRITFGMIVFWTYGSVCTMYVHSPTYIVRRVQYQNCIKVGVFTLHIRKF